MAFKEGDEVKWKWGDGHAHGSVKKVYTDEITRTIKGSEITRNATKDCPAYYIEQSNGAHVLKLHSEVDAYS